MATAWCHAYTELWLTFLQYPTKGESRGRGRQSYSFRTNGGTKYHSTVNIALIINLPFPIFHHANIPVQDSTTAQNTHWVPRGLSDMGLGLARAQWVPVSWHTLLRESTPHNSPGRLPSQRPVLQMHLSNITGMAWNNMRGQTEHFFPLRRVFRCSAGL